MNLPALKDSFVDFSVAIYLTESETYSLSKEIKDFVSETGMMSANCGTRTFTMLCKSIVNSRGSNTVYCLFWISPISSIKEEKDHEAVLAKVARFVELVGEREVIVTIDLSEKYNVKSLPAAGFVTALRGLSNDVGDMTLSLNGASFAVTGPSTSSFKWKEITEQSEQFVVAEANLWYTWICSDNVLQQAFDAANRSLKFLVLNESTES